MDESLIDLIYEASVIPERWPDVLTALSITSGSHGTALFVTDLHQVSRWTSSPNLQAHMQEWIDGGWQSRTQRTTRMLARGHLGFVKDLDVFSLEEWQQDPSHAGFFRPRGYGWASGTFIPMPTGDTAVVNVERLIEQGSMKPDQIQRLDALRGHLARSSLISARLRLETARNTADLFATLGLPAAVLGPRGHVLAINVLLEEMPGIKARAFGRLAYQPDSSRSDTNDIFAQIAEGVSRPRSIPLPARDGHPPVVVHEIPVTRSAHDVFGGGHKLIYLTPLKSDRAPDAHILAGLFDLTPGEARVAQKLATGHGIDLAASELAVSRETVRSQLKSILRKTGVKGQAELVSLLAGARSGKN